MGFSASVHDVIAVVAGRHKGSGCDVITITVARLPTLGPVHPDYLEVVDITLFARGMDVLPLNAMELVSDDDSSDTTQRVLKIARGRIARMTSKT